MTALSVLLFWRMTQHPEQAATVTPSIARLLKSFPFCDDLSDDPPLGVKKLRYVIVLSQSSLRSSHLGHVESTVLLPISLSAAGAVPRRRSPVALGEQCA